MATQEELQHEIDTLSDELRTAEDTILELDKSLQSCRQNFRKLLRNSKNAQGRIEELLKCEKKSRHSWQELARKLGVANENVVREARKTSKALKRKIEDLESGKELKREREFSELQKADKEMWHRDFDGILQEIDEALDRDDEDLRKSIEKILQKNGY